MRAHYPNWNITKPVRETMHEIHAAWLRRAA
jgi:hypothetical protein